MSRTDDERLRDIVESIDAVDRADALLRARPQDAEVEQVAVDAIHYRVFTIGEADPQIVRATIGDPIARLRVACEAMLAERSQPEDETDFLLGNPANARRLLASIERLESHGELKPERSE